MINTYTVTTRLITDTTATVGQNDSVSYTYPQNRSGLSKLYSILGLRVAVETTKQRGWECYETVIRIGYKGHWDSPAGFSEWYDTYKKSIGTYSTHLMINSVRVERHTATRLAETHDLGVIASESYVLTIINKYIECLFNDVKKENITRNINELKSELATIN